VQFLDALAATEDATSLPERPVEVLPPEGGETSHTSAL